MRLLHCRHEQEKPHVTINYRTAAGNTPPPKEVSPDAIGAAITAASQAVVGNATDFAASDKDVITLTVKNKVPPDN